MSISIKSPLSRGTAIIASVAAATWAGDALGTAARAGKAFRPRLLMPMAVIAITIAVFDKAGAFAPSPAPLEPEQAELPQAELPQAELPQAESPSDSVADSAPPITFFRLKAGLKGDVVPAVNRECEELLSLLEAAIHPRNSSSPQKKLTTEQKRLLIRLLNTTRRGKGLLKHLDEIVRSDGSIDGKHRYSSPVKGALEEIVYGRNAYNSCSDSD